MAAVSLLNFSICARSLARASSIDALPRSISFALAKSIELALARLGCILTCSPATSMYLTPFSVINDAK
jgi:hypothetical protein